VTERVKKGEERKKRRPSGKNCVGKKTYNEFPTVGEMARNVREAQSLNGEESFQRK